MGGSFEADFYRYHLHSFKLDGSRTIFPLQLIPDRRMPVSYPPTSFDGQEEWPWERDVPTLWNESRPGRLEMGLPLARNLGPGSSTALIEVLENPGLVSFKNARSPVGPQSLGDGIASYQRDLSRGWLRRKTGDDLLICDEQPRWMRVSCDGNRCVAICLVPSSHDMWPKERLLIRRFLLAD